MKYVSPTFNGFTFAADWVVTDFWDVALRYRKEIAGFDIGAGIGYLQLQPGSRTRSVCPAAFFTGGEDATSCRQLRGSVRRPRVGRRRLERLLRHRRGRRPDR